MKEFESARKIYNKIDLSLNDKKIPRYKLARKLGIANSTFSDYMKKLKNGKFIPLIVLINIQDKLKIKLVNF